MMTKPLSKKIEKSLREGGKSIEKALKKLKPKDRPAAAAVVAAGIAGIVAAIHLLRRGKNGVASFHVVPGADGGWELTAEGQGEPIEALDSKRQAVRLGRETAAKSAPSELVIHRSDGSIQTSHSYKA